MSKIIKWDNEICEDLITDYLKSTKDDELLKMKKVAFFKSLGELTIRIGFKESRDYRSYIKKCVRIFDLLEMDESSNVPEDERVDPLAYLESLVDEIPDDKFDGDKEFVKWQPWQAFSIMTYGFSLGKAVMCATCYKGTPDVLVDEDGRTRINLKSDVYPNFNADLETIN